MNYKNELMELLTLTKDELINVSVGRGKELFIKVLQILDDVVGFQIRIEKRTQILI